MVLPWLSMVVVLRVVLCRRRVRKCQVVRVLVGLSVVVVSSWSERSSWWARVGSVFAAAFVLATTFGWLSVSLASSSEWCVWELYASEPRLLVVGKSRLALALAHPP